MVYLVFLTIMLDAKILPCNFLMHKKIEIPTALTGMLSNSKQRATQMVVVFYHLTLKNHIYLPGLVMIDIVDSLESSNKFVPIKKYK